MRDYNRDITSDMCRLKKYFDRREDEVWGIIQRTFLFRIIIRMQRE